MINPPNYEQISANNTHNKAKKIKYISEIKSAVKDSPEGFINSCEEEFRGQIDNIAESIIKHINSTGGRIVLLSGPSSSGKTTSAALIKNALNQKGVSSVFISLDNFYLEKEKLPLLPNGNADYESVKCLNIDEINYCFSKLLTDNHADMPIFDFIKSRPVGYKSISADENTIFIIEGIHALNPSVLSANFNSFKVYISTETEFWDEQIVMSPGNLRFIRRMIRDFYTRGVSVKRTVSLWDNVRAGEEKYIEPFKHTVDISIDSVHAYEPMIYANYVETVINTNAPRLEYNGSEYNSLISSISRTLDYFGKINIQLIPKISLINEFLGINAE